MFCEFGAGGRGLKADFSGQHCVESTLYLAETFWQSRPCCKGTAWAGGHCSCPRFVLLWAVLHSVNLSNR
ncbi:hypothetical protein WJX77_010570 [Trebouxia sp. C0004]